MSGGEVSAAPDVPAEGAAVVRMTGMRKTFGDIVALDGVDFDLAPREVHGLLGGNGAGKTTLMNVLYGLYRADAGQIAVHGRPVRIASPRDALRLGVGMVHQHFLQVPPYTVVENVVLGSPLPRRPVLDLRLAQQSIGELSERFGLQVDLTARVEDLPIGARQRVEILKALYRDVGTLILDEPTSNLTPQEVDSLFGSLQMMVAEGMSIVFITHKIREALAVCDRMSVLRDGRNAARLSRTEAGEHTLADAMVGGEPRSVRSAVSVLQDTKDTAPRAAAPEPGSARIAVEDVSVTLDGGATAVRGCSLRAAASEILGVAGVAGNGQSELAEVLAGVRAPDRGLVRVDGDDLTGAGPARFLDAGVAYIPEDRSRDGVLPALSVAQNLILGHHRSPTYRRGPLLDAAVVTDEARRTMAEFDIRAPGPDAPAGALSGGNIQRLILARVFSRAPGVLVAHNPTRGLDITSTESLYRRILECRNQRTATVLISEDLDELMYLSDRIAVMFAGGIVDVLERDAFDRYAIGRLMSGVQAG